MKVYRSLKEFQPVRNAVVTQGTFDGVHLGHQKILKKLKDIADEINGETVLITYFPHPRMVLYPDDDSLKMLSTIDEKAELLKGYGVDHLLILEFTEEFAKQSAVEFIKDVLVKKIGAKRVVIGYDHRFGSKREGSFDHLKELASKYGYEVEEIDKCDIDEVAVSSTKIREAIMEGDMAAAKKYIGRNYFFHGEVVMGEQVGRGIGFPTANIHLKEKYKLMPADGVYAVLVHVGGMLYKGMLNIGFRPTLSGNRKTIEVHIFDFDKDIYGERLKIEMVEKIRDEDRFESLQKLKQQLEIDKLKSLNILQSHE